MTMNRQGRVAVIASAALLVGLGAAACGPDDDWLAIQAEIPVHGEGAPGIDESIDTDMITFLAENDLPGATVALTRAGRLVWSKAYGWANEAEQRPMQPWHRSRIGSVSKVITAIGLLQLLEPETGIGDLGSITVGGTDLASQLSRKLYGHPGADVDTPTWPTVTGPTVLNDPESYWEAIRLGVQNAYPETYQAEMATMIEWASQVELRHLLTHTASYILNGDAEEAAAYFGDEWNEAYAQVHQFNLLGQRLGDEGGDSVQCWLDGQFYVDKDDPAYTGQDYVLPPLLNEPGTKWCYSNHGFGVAGLAIQDLSGGATYPQVIKQNILDPLGLTDVVPKNTEINEELDAWPHGSSLNPDDVNLLGTAAGGWSASARDLVQIMCGLDRGSDNLRLLEPPTVTTMEVVAFPAAKSTQPLGWDSITNNRLYKNGATGGGRSVIIKYLPGKFATAPQDEINVAVNVNSGGTMPPESLLSSIATAVAAADIADDYDLFDPAYACMAKPELGLVNPTAGPSTPTPGASTLVNPTPTTTFTTNTRPSVPPTPTTGSPGPLIIDPPETRTPRVPPTVTIHLPYNGWQPAPNGVAQIPFQGTAVDSSGTTIPGTRLRWTAIQGDASNVLCVGSAFGPAPSTIGGIVNPADCTSFTRQFTNPVSGSGPSITIRLEARDQSGLVGSAEVVIALYTPPAR
jgi:CubicO group peptidase (beta-lactamase class C family)